VTHNCANIVIWVYQEGCLPVPLFPSSRYVLAGSHFTLWGCHPNSLTTWIQIGYWVGEYKSIASTSYRRGISAANK